jgi:hypothetical protein
MNTAVAHYYRKFRANNPLYPAAAAYQSARSFVYFRERLAKDVADHKKRSRAAKKAWKVRKAKGRS